MLAEEWSGDDTAKPNRPTTDGAEYRSEPRTITLFKTAAILSRGRAGLCVIKNMSSGGAMIKTALPLSIGDPVEIALASGAKVEGVVRWQRDGFHGIQFEIPIDVATILSNGADTPSARNARRSPRLVINVSIRVESSTNIVSAVTHNISTHGMRIISEGRIGKGHAIVWLPNIPSKSARILWSEHGQAGCAFDQPFQIDELTSWAVKAMAHIDPTEPNHRP